MLVIDSKVGNNKKNLEVVPTKWCANRVLISIHIEGNSTQIHSNTNKQYFYVNSMSSM